MPAPVPEWATSSIFLSSDLLVSIFAHCEVADWACALSCKLWHQCWLATDDSRRGLRTDSAAALQQPAFEHGAHVERIFAPPSGAWFCLLVEVQDPNFEEAPLCHIYMADASMSHVRDMMRRMSHGVVRGCANESMLYMSSKGTVTSINVADDRWVLTARHREDEKCLAEVALAPKADILFAAAYNRHGGPGEDEVIALDVATLAVRYRFGGTLFRHHIMGLAVDDDSVYVGDDAAGSIVVFNHGGERLREMHGDWSTPSELCYFGGRLYVLEEWGFLAHSAGDVGMRVLTLSTAGEKLGVWQSGGHTARSIVIAGRRLVVTLNAKAGNDSASRLRVEETHLVALKGI